MLILEMIIIAFAMIIAGLYYLDYVPDKWHYTYGFCVGSAVQAVLYILA